MTADKEPLAELMVRYQGLVARYQALDRQIDRLLMANGGHSEKLSTQDMAQYRTWAQERDDIFSEMRALEQELALDDEA